MQFFRHLITSILGRWKIYYLDKRLTRLKLDYVREIGNSDNTAKLCQIISEIGMTYNEIIKHKYGSLVNTNGRKDLEQVLKSVELVIDQANKRIKRNKREIKKREVFIKGLLGIKSALDDWDPSL